MYSTSKRPEGVTPAVYSAAESALPLAGSGTGAGGSGTLAAVTSRSESLMTKLNTVRNDVTLSAPNCAVRLFTSAGASGPARAPTSFAESKDDGPPPATMTDRVSGRFGFPV